MGKLAKLKRAWNAIKSKKSVQRAIAKFKKAHSDKGGSVDFEALENAQTPEDYVRFAATVASIVDPTGIAGVVSAFTYPTCDKLALYSQSR